MRLGKVRDIFFSDSEKCPFFFFFLFFLFSGHLKLFKKHNFIKTTSGKEERFSFA